VFSDELPESAFYDIPDIKKLNVNSASGRLSRTRERYRNESSTSTQRERKSRKPSSVSPLGLTDHIYNTSHAWETLEELKQRIDVLQASTKSIEDTVSKLCECLDESKERM